MKKGRINFFIFITIFIPACGIHQVTTSVDSNSSDLKNLPEPQKSCFIIEDVETSKVVFRSDNGLCNEQTYPASTFDVPLALMAFNRGILTKDTILKWDGTAQLFKTWEKNQNTKGWLQDSVVWFSQRLTHQLGQDRIIRYLEWFSYGNHDFSGGSTSAWLGSSLKISAEEQVNFLAKVRSFDFELRPHVIENVLSIIPVEVNQPNLKIYGKAGSTNSLKDVSAEAARTFGIGWYTGYLEKNHRVYAFAHVAKENSKGETSVLAAEIKRLSIPILTNFTDPENKGESVSTEKWLQDYEQLKKIVADVYPNLETKLHHTKMNFFELNKKYTAKIQNASSNVDAKNSLFRFVSEFHDGHFKLQAFRSNQLQDNGPKKVRLNYLTSAEVACRFFISEKSKKISFAFPMPKALGFEKLSGNGDFFQTSTLILENKKIGFIRIPSFAENIYPEVCPSEWEKFRKQISNTCEEGCEDRFRDEFLGNRMLLEFSKALTGLNEKKISALVLDLRDNGGGTDWVAGIMRILTDQPIVCGQFGFIRHPHWTKQLLEEESELEKEMKTTKDFERIKGIEAQLDRVKNDLVESQKMCDRSKIWTQKKYQPVCSATIKYPVIECSPQPVFKFTAAVYKGPLFILVNESTASASEDLVGRYKDSKIAMIIGEKTLGAGCGHTNGGLDLKLKNSGLKVKMPDCARFLRDGSNEVEGITPDIKLNVKDLETQDFTVRLIKLLSKEIKTYP